MLSFSTMGSTVAISILHLPLSLPELFFIPIVYLLRHRFFPINWDKKVFVWLVLLQIFLVMLAVLSGTFPLFDVLSSSRGFIYIYMFYSIYKKNNRLASDDMIYICLGSIIGWSLSSMMNLNAILYGGKDYDVTYGNMLAVALFICYSILNKKWKIFIIGFILLLIINFTAGLRRLTLVIVLTFVLANFVYIIQSHKARLKQFVFLIFILVPLYFVFPYISEKIEETSPVLYIRVIEKTQRVFEGEAGDSGDELRSSNIQKFSHNLDDFIFPSGMVSFMSLKKYENLKDGSVGIYMDFPLLALSRIFSFPVFLIIVLVFLNRGFKCLKLYKNYSEPDAGVYMIMYVVMFTLLFLEGTFINYPYATPFTGLCIGRLSFFAKKYNYLSRYTNLIKR